MSNYFDTPGILDEWDSLKSYVKANTPEQMLSDIRNSTIDPNDLLALGDLIKMATDNEALRHARISYAEGIRRIDANPHLLAKDVSLFDAKWNVVACSLDIDDGFVEASKLIETEPRFFLDENLELSLMTAMRLWAGGHIHECGSILDKLDAIKGISGKLEEAGLEPALFEKLKMWVVERRRRGA